MTEKSQLASNGQSSDKVLLSTFLEDLAAKYPAIGSNRPVKPAEIAELIIKNAPEGERPGLLARLFTIVSQENKPAGLGYGALALIAAGLLIAATLVYGIFVRPDFLASVADAATARGLITFLFAFGTMAVILIISIATFWTNIEEVERRFALAKDVLTILIGILGTILGFYFGTMNQPAPGANPQHQTVPLK